MFAQTRQSRAHTIDKPEWMRRREPKDLEQIRSNHVPFSSPWHFGPALGSVLCVGSRRRTASALLMSPTWRHTDGTYCRLVRFLFVVKGGPVRALNVLNS